MTTTDQIIALLVAERDRLTRAIDALQGPTKQRGRPPKNPVFGLVAPSAAKTGSKRSTRTAAQRAAQAEKMRAYWAKRRKES